MKVWNGTNDRKTGRSIEKYWIRVVFWVTIGLCLLAGEAAMSQDYWNKGLEFLSNYIEKKAFTEWDGLALTALQGRCRGVSYSLVKKLNNSIAANCNVGYLTDVNKWIHKFIHTGMLFLWSIPHRGWVMEEGACREWPAAVVGISSILEHFHWVESSMPDNWHEQLTEDLQFVLEQRGKDGWWHQKPGSSLSDELRSNLHAFLMLAMAMEHGLMGGAEDEKLLLSMGEELMDAVLSNDMDGDRNDYDVSLLLRGLKLIGSRMDVEVLRKLLLCGQNEFGGWSDNQIGDDFMVTCSVLLALQLTEPCEVEVAVPMVWINGECSHESGIQVEEGKPILSEVIEESNTIVTDVLLRRTGGTVLEYYGRMLRSVWGTEIPGHDRENIYQMMILTESLAPGDYELVFRHWSKPSGCFIGETVLPLHVANWFRVEGVILRPSVTRTHAYVGDVLTLIPEVDVYAAGNQAESCIVYGEMTSPDGKVLMEFPGCFLEMSGSGVHEACLAERLFQPTSAGRYVLRVWCEQNDICHENSRVIYVDERTELRTECELEPEVLPIEKSVGVLKLRILRTSGGFHDGLAVSFVQKEIPRAVAGETACEVVLENVVNENGSALTNGMVVLHCVYGRCLGGVPLVVGYKDGSLTVHSVVDGVCRVKYLADGSGGVCGGVPIRVYACENVSEDVEMRDYIGTAQVMVLNPDTGDGDSSEDIKLHAEETGAGEQETNAL